MNIDRLAPWYRWLEYAAFGRALQQSRVVFFDRLATARRILVFGEGDGRALARLLAMAPLAQVDVVELSGAMIELARCRAGDQVNRVRFHQLDARGADWPDGSFDAIVTLFFLDCFCNDELKALIPRIADRMSADAVWLIADFSIPATGWRRLHALAWVKIMYAFFSTATALRTRFLPEIDSVLGDAGFTQRDSCCSRAGLIRCQIWKKDYTP